MKIRFIKIIALMLALVLSLMALASCAEKTPAASTPNSNDSGSNNNGGSSDEVVAPDYDFMGNDLTGIVKLGQYKDYTLEVAPKVIITEEYFAEEINKEIILFGEHTELKEGTVKESDIVKIKFVGYMDGEKFEGGEGTQEYFTIYDGGGFIEGFAEGVIGAEVGKEIDVNVTFPEDYGKEELNGKPAVFKVTVECIYQAKEMTDELVEELSGGKMKTYAEFKESAWKLMEENAETEYRNAKLTAVWDKILDSAETLELPEDVIKQYYDYLVYSYQQYATQYWMTLESFLEYIGMTLDDVQKEAEKTFFADAVLYSIIKAENITLTQEEFDADLKEMMEYYGVTEDDVYDVYTEEELEEMFLYSKGYEAVLEWSTFVDKAESAE